MKAARVYIIISKTIFTLRYPLFFTCGLPPIPHERPQEACEQRNGSNAMGLLFFVFLLRERLSAAFAKHTYSFDVFSYQPFRNGGLAISREMAGAETVEDGRPAYVGTRQSRSACAEFATSFAPIPRPPRGWAFAP